MHPVVGGRRLKGKSCSPTSSKLCSGARLNVKRGDRSKRPARAFIKSRRTVNDDCQGPGLLEPWEPTVEPSPPGRFHPCQASTAAQRSTRRSAATNTLEGGALAKLRAHWYGGNDL